MKTSFLFIYQRQRHSISISFGHCDRPDIFIGLHVILDIKGQALYYVVSTLNTSMKYEVIQK